jgi:hypothetical protein
MNQCTYVVVPFERHGSTIGPRQALVCVAPSQARALAQELASRFPGIAVLERSIDPETGDDVDTVIAEFGAIPPRFPASRDWTIRLN